MGPWPHPEVRRTGCDISFFLVINYKNFRWCHKLTWPLAFDLGCDPIQMWWGVRCVTYHSSQEWRPRNSVVVTRWPGPWRLIWALTQSKIEEENGVWHVIISSNEGQEIWGGHKLTRPLTFDLGGERRVTCHYFQQWRARNSEVVTSWPGPWPLIWALHPT